MCWEYLHYELACIQESVPGSVSQCIDRNEIISMPKYLEMFPCRIYVLTIPQLVFTILTSWYIFVFLKVKTLA